MDRIDSDHWTDSIDRNDRIFVRTFEEMAPVLRKLQWIRLTGARAKRGVFGSVLTLSILALALGLSLPAAAEDGDEAAEQAAGAMNEAVDEAAEASDADLDAAAAATEDAAAEAASDAEDIVEDMMDAAEAMDEADEVDAVEDVPEFADEERAPAAWSANADLVVEEEEEEDFYQTELWVPTMSLALSVHEEELDMVGENPLAFSINTTEAKTLIALRFGAELMSPRCRGHSAEAALLHVGGCALVAPGEFSLQHPRGHRRNERLPRHESRPGSPQFSPLPGRGSRRQP